MAKKRAERMKYLRNEKKLKKIVQEKHEMICEHC